MASELRQRVRPSLDDVAAEKLSPATHVNGNVHPSGRKKHGRLVQFLRGLSFIVFFFTCVITIQITQWIGSPLYFIRRDLFYDYMAVTKQSFGLLITTMTRWWGPTTIRISGDESMAGQLKKTKDGRVEFDFPERLVLIANHQIYTDWLYLWWVAYANSPPMHGHIYIILKESLKYIPFIGPGMMFYGFIFMSRKMAVDQPRMAHRLQMLRKSYVDPSGRPYRNPMWLLLFPEGTNASDNGRVKSAKWAEKMGIKDPRHLLLPRSTGMYFCLKELEGSVDYVYDCTVAYEGIPRGDFGENYFTLSSTYFRGQPPKSVNFHWRRFRVSDIPLDDTEKFDEWLRERWYEKDAMLEQYLATGRLPASPKATGSKDDAYIETAVRTRTSLEIAQLFSVVGTALVFYHFAVASWQRYSPWGSGVKHH